MPLKAARVGHPGRLLRREFDAWKWPIPEDLREIEAGRASVTPVVAERLSQLFGTSAQFWLNLQANYDEWRGDEGAAATDTDQ